MYANTEDSRLVDARMVYNWLNSYATDFYGKQILVFFDRNEPLDSQGVPLNHDVCRTFDEDTKQETYSHEPSTEGGWPSEIVTAKGVTDLYEKQNVLGLVNKITADPSIPLEIDLFKDERGMLQPILRYNKLGAKFQRIIDGQGVGKIDLKRLDPNNYILDQNIPNPNIPNEISTDTLWVKAEIHPEWIIGSPLVQKIGPDGSIGIVPSPPYGDRMMALLKLDAPVVLQDTTLDANMLLDVVAPIGNLEHGSSRALANRDDWSSWAKKYNRGGEQTAANPGGQEATVNAIGPQACWPNGAGVPLKSNVQTYGPWHMRLSTDSTKNKRDPLQKTLPGGVQCEIDEGLVVWVSWVWLQNSKF